MLAALLTVWALAVAAVDVARRRGPNLLLAVLAIPAAVTLAVRHHGLLGVDVPQSLLGLSLGAAPLLAGYLMRQVGAGDVKLAALQGLILGVFAMGEALLVSALMLGLISAVVALRAKAGGKAASRLPAAPALVVGFMVIVLEQQLR